MCNYRSKLVRMSPLQLQSCEAFWVVLVSRKRSCAKDFLATKAATT